MQPLNRQFIDFWKSSNREFCCDENLLTENNPASAVSQELLKIITSRADLRSYCQEKKLQVPDFYCFNQFNKISAWAVNKNRFPLVLKTSENKSNCDKILMLKAFRELPQFFEDVAENSGASVIIEEYVTAKAYFEVMLFNSQIKLISQTGFDKSMRLRHSWRAFPIKLPEKVNDQVIKIMESFPEIVSIQNIPVRFSFALTRPELTLLSVNTGINRHEYHPDWSQACGLGELLTKTLKSPQTENLSKTLLFYELAPEFSQESDLKSICSQTCKAIWQQDDTLAMLLSSDNPQALIEEGKRARAHMQQYRQVQISENEEVSGPD